MKPIPYVLPSLTANARRMPTSTARRVLLPLGLAFMPTVVAAECQVRFLQPSIDLGTSIYSSAAESDYAGFRQIGGPRTAMLSVACDVDRTTLRLAFVNIAPLEKGLLRWDGAQSSGALVLRVVRATAEGIPVNMVLAEKPPASAVDIAKDGEILGVDLSGIHKARNFNFEIQMVGLVRKSFVPTRQTTYSMTPRVQLLDP